MKQKIRFLVLVLLVLSFMTTACVSEEASTDPAEEAAPTEVVEESEEEDVADEAPEVEDAEEEDVADDDQEAEDVDVIKVGALYPVTGPDAGWAGDPYIKSHQMAINEINEAGGISCLGGAKLELVIGDTQSSAEKGNSEMERLITEENVVAVMGSALSGTTNPATVIAEKYEIPYIVPNCLDGTVTSRGLEYVFQTVSLMQNWGIDDANWVAENGAETAVITVPNITFGSEVEEIWSEAIPAAGMELLGSFTYSANTNDFTDTILRVKQLDPDVWFALGNAETGTFVKQMKEQGYWPKYGVITLGSGFATSVFLDNAGADHAEGILFTMDFAPVSALPVSEEFKTEFKEFTGQDLGGTYNTTYASTWLLADALEEACSSDPKEVAQTLRTTTFKDGEWDFMWPEVSFDDNGRLEQAPTVIGQWQDGQMVAIWPEDFAAADPIWPVPQWGER